MTGGVATLESRRHSRRSPRAATGKAACEGRGREQQGAGLRRHVAARGGETPVIA